MKSKTDPRILRTRAMLQDALLALLAEKPFRQIHVSDITEHAGLARPTFYLHFQSKEELLLSHLDNLFEAYLEQMQPLIGKEDQGELARLLFEQLQNNSGLVMLIAEMEDEIANLVMQRLQQYIRTVIRLISPVQIPEGEHSALADFAMASITGSTHAIVIQWIRAGMPYTPHQMGQILNSLVRPGVINVLVNRVLDDVFQPSTRVQNTGKNK